MIGTLALTVLIFVSPDCPIFQSVCSRNSQTQAAGCVIADMNEARRLAATRARSSSRQLTSIDVSANCALVIRSAARASNGSPVSRNIRTIGCSG